MSDISVIGNAMVGNVRSTTPPTTGSAVEVESTERSTDSAPHAMGADRTDHVEFSEQAKWLERIHQLPEVRQEIIDSLKEEIACDTYLTEDKLQIAFQRLIEEVQG